MASSKKEERKVGRPASVEETRNKRIPIYVNTEEREVLGSAASTAGLTIGMYIRQAALKEARKGDSV